MYVVIYELKNVMWELASIGTIGFVIGFLVSFLTSHFLYLLTCCSIPESIMQLECLERLDLTSNALTRCDMKFQ